MRRIGLDPEKRRETLKAYGERHREVLRAQKKSWYEVHKPSGTRLMLPTSLRPECADCTHLRADTQDCGTYLHPLLVGSTLGSSIGKCRGWKART